MPLNPKYPGQGFQSRRKHSPSFHHADHLTIETFQENQAETPPPRISITDARSPAIGMVFMN